MNRSFLTLCCLLFLSVSCQTHAESPAARNTRMQWWREARFGMFIHWGLYSVPAGEWNGGVDHAEWIRTTAQIPLAIYDQFAAKFNPTNFDADAWVELAREAGMKYLVITSKHHDGFCLWPSEHTEFDVAATPFQRDILGELKAACDREGIRFCLYHSIMDWHHPDYLPRREWEKDRPVDGAELARYVDTMKAQLKELVDRYDPAVLWFDGEWEETWTHEMGIDLDDYVRQLNPQIIVNNRVDKGRQGMQGMTKVGEFRGDFGTPEQEIPATGVPGVDWESCMTMNDHWGYNSHDQNYKSSEDLIRKLVDIVSKGGNFLLNVGPTATGEFPPPSVARLRDIGAWMHTNGESIYGAQASPIDAPVWGRVTRRDNRLFLHVFDWPSDNQLHVAVPGKPLRASLLSSREKPLRVTTDSQGIAMDLGDRPTPSPVPIVELVMENVAEGSR